MEITKLATVKKENTTVLLLKGFGFRQANVLRRYIKDYVPTMAIERVQFSKNSSALYDEIVAQRLGLLPLKTDLSSYVLPSECTCGGEGCAKCTLQMSLSAKGPGTVYAESIASKDRKVIPVYPKTPIVMLLERQEIEFIATAVLGQGFVHAKWSPAHVYYRGAAVPVPGKDADLAAIEKKYPKIFSVSGKQLKVLDPLLVTEAVEGFCEEHGVAIEHSDKDILFFVESYGQLSAKEILNEAVAQFTKQLHEVKEAL